jgi:hypothetical protein
MPTPITTPLVASGVRDVYIAQERYAIVATSGGIDVIDLFKGFVITSGTLPSEPTTVVADWENIWGRLYIGTTSSGVFDMQYNLIREEGRDLTDQFVQRFTTSTPIPLSSNQINDIDVRPGRLLIGTGAGIDFIADETVYMNFTSPETEYATRPLISGSEHVALTEAGGYWTTATGVFLGAVEVNYDLLSTTGTSIIDIDFEYRKTSNPALPAEPPFDISVVEPTDGPLPAIGVATSGGVYVFEEEPGNESSANTKLLSAEAFITCDFDPNAAFNSGCLFAGKAVGAIGTRKSDAGQDIGGELKVFDLGSNSVSGTHNAETGTRGIVLVTGTMTVARAVDIGYCPTSIDDTQN